VEPVAEQVEPVAEQVDAWDALAHAATDGPTGDPKPKHAALAAESATREATDPHRIPPIDDLVDVFGVDVFGEGEKARPLATLPALCAIASHYRLRPRHNLLSHDNEVWWQGAPHIEGMEWLDSVAAREHYSAAGVGRYLPTLAKRDAYHPVGEWIQSKAWDGRDRLPELLATLTPTPEGLAAAYIQRWMRGAAALACLPEPTTPGGQLGCVMQGMLTLKGPQNIRKSSWIEALSPRSEWVLGGQGVCDLSNKDVVAQLTAAWIVEFAEVDGMIQANSAEKLKGFLTRAKDRYRTPYAVRHEDHQRRTAYAGTTNADTFLVDPSGNRRWWVVDVDMCDPGALIQRGPEWRQQVWAQAWADWQREGQYSHVLTPAELEQSERSNTDKHRELSAEEIALLDHFDVSAPESVARKNMTTAEIYRTCGLNMQTTGSTRKMTAALRRYFGEQGKAKGARYWRVVPRCHAVGPSERGA
jgi:putative DNA primase/helicase